MPTEETTETTDDTEDQESEGTDEGTGNDTGDSDAKAKIAKVNREAAQLRKRAKAAEDRLAEIEEADKSEAQKLADRAAAAEKAAAEAQAKADRLEIAAEKGLTPQQAARLQGATREDLEADADELLELFKSSTGEDDGKPSGAPRQKPRELQGGNDPESEGSGNESLADIGKAMFSR
ncbi:MAG: hypothetical protein R2754_00015 [Microthrixaceae bacterium]